jgi:hypothetical protein
MLESTQNLLKGPSVYQDQNYKTGFRYDSDPIPYIATFRMKIGLKPDVPLNIGELRVIIKYPVGDEIESQIQLARKVLTTDDFESIDYKDIKVSFIITGLPKIL